MPAPGGPGVLGPDLSRRGFLVGGTLALGALATACGDSHDGARGGSSVDTFSAVFQGLGAGEGIDPSINHQFIDLARITAMYDGLFEVDDRMVPVPRLATAGEPNADGTRWRITLRDARWHDGTKFTSEDVLYTLSRILGPARSKPFIAANALKQVDLSQSKASGDHAVEVALKHPSFDFLSALCATGTKMVQKDANDFSKPVGTGPFRFESFEAGKQLTAGAYHDYWDSAPNIRTLKILSAGDTARLTAMRGGQADYADNLTASAVRTLKDAEGISVHTTPNSGVHYFAMKTDRPPFDNVDVRRALMHMVDRHQLVKVALEGHGEIANDAFGKGYRYYAGDLPQHTFDPGTVRRLLHEAGVRDLEFDLFTAPVASGFVEAARLFAGQAKKCGVKVNVVVGSKDTYYAEALKRGELTMGQTGPFPVPNYFAERMLTGAPQNRTKWSDAEFDALYATAQAASSEKERARVYHRMYEIAYQRGGFLNWAEAAWSSASKTKFKNIPAGVPNSTG